MMRFFTLAAIFCLASVFKASGQEKTRVLFLGNSYTAFNNLPEIFKNFSNQGGDSTYVESNTPGGFTLNGHSTNPQSLSMIQQGDWDFVVLQEQSQLPSFPISQVQSQCFPFATALDQEINAYNECAETVFYMTWGRENGDASNCSNWPPVCTYEGMDSLLAERYMTMGQTNNAIVSPVGAVWKRLREAWPAMQLYAGDGSHPSPEGSYAAACAFYTVIHRKDPELITWDFSLTSSQAAIIRNAAKLVVYDSLSKYYVGNYDTVPTASFTFDTTALAVSFTNTSIDANSYLWVFGDGDSSTNEHPGHAYASNGTYTVELTAYHCDSAHTISQEVTVFKDTVPADTTTGIDMPSGQRILVFPNPTKGELYIQTNNLDGAITIAVRNQLGALVVEKKGLSGNNIELDTRTLQPGIYQVEVRTFKTNLSTKIQVL